VKRKPLLAVWRDALGDDPTLTSTGKLVGYALSTWMNGRGVCYPSRATIASRCSLSDRAVDKALTQLETRGYVEIERSKGGNPRTGTNVYTATLPEGANEVRRSEWGGANLRTPRGEPDDVSSERRSPESVESVRKRRGAAQDSAPGVEDECQACHKRRVVLPPDFRLCADCSPDEVTAVA